MRSFYAPGRAATSSQQPTNDSNSAHDGIHSNDLEVVEKTINSAAYGRGIIVKESYTPARLLPGLAMYAHLADARAFQTQEAIDKQRSKQASREKARAKEERKQAKEAKQSKQLTLDAVWARSSAASASAAW